MTQIVGIDLGTTNSLIGYYSRDSNDVVLIPNALGDLLTPSVVAFDEKGALQVGRNARYVLAQQPEHAAAVFKLSMGTDKQFKLGNKSFRAEELSAMVLKSLKEDAERHLGTEITGAVITVPAFFNDKQRKATRSAAEIAGLNVLRLLNEPTAAGLAYGINESVVERQFLIFDLGGGTFDVSIIDFFDGVVQIQASAGDTNLGGEHFNRVIVQELRQQLGNYFLKLSRKLSAKDSEVLASEAEKIKRQLGKDQTVTGSVKIGKKDVEYSFSRDLFERESMDLLKRIRDPIERAMRDAKIKPDDLEEIVLVGGSSRMPIIRRLVTQLFGRLPLRQYNPDEVIARGACVMAGMLEKNEKLQEFVLTDVMPFTLGTRISEEYNGRYVNNIFSPIIERNTPIPCSREEQYIAHNIKQTDLKFEILQGESPHADQNIKLGELVIKTASGRNEYARASVRFSYDLSGILAVDVKDESSDHQVSALIEQQEGVLTEAEKQAAIKRLEAIKIPPQELSVNTHIIRQLEYLYAESLGTSRAYWQRLLSSFEGTLKQQNPEDIQEMRQEIQKIIDEYDHNVF